MTTISLFYSYEKVLILMNIEMIGKNSMKHHYLNFYSHLNMEDISDADYAHAKRVCKDFEMKILEDFYGFYVQSNYCWLMYLRIIEIYVLKNMKLILQNFFQLLD